MKESLYLIVAFAPPVLVILLLKKLFKEKKKEKKSASNSYQMDPEYSHLEGNIYNRDRD